MGLGGFPYKGTGGRYFFGGGLFQGGGPGRGVCRYRLPLFGGDKNLEFFFLSFFYLDSNA